MGSSAQSSAVLFERREHIGIITLNRPEAMNAVNAALATALEGLLTLFVLRPQAVSPILGAAGRLSWAHLRGRALRTSARPLGRRAGSTCPVRIRQPSATDG